MKTTLLATLLWAVLHFPMLAQLSTMDSIHANLIDIQSVDTKKLFQTDAKPFLSPGIPTSWSIDSLCNSNDNLIVQLEDSLYVYSPASGSYRFICRETPGYATSFDVVEHDSNLQLVSAVHWDSIYYMSGGAWKYSGYFLDSQSDMIHVGASRDATFLMGGHVYFFNGYSHPRQIRRWISYAAADLVVDEYKNAWILTCKTWSYADTLKIIDSTGASVCELPFEHPVNTFNAYGMVIRNKQLYVAFGDANPNFPNSMVPLVIDEVHQRVRFGTPEPANPANTIDLGGCSKMINEPKCFRTLDATDPQTKEFGPLIFPTPFDDRLTIRWPGYQIARVVLYDGMGRQILSHRAVSTETSLNTQAVSKGLVLAKIELQNGATHFARLIKR